MIGSALELLKNHINEYLLKLPELKINNEEKIVLDHINDQNGNQIKENFLYISLVNIEEERVLKAQNGSVTNNDGIVSYMNPEIRLNLFVLISSYFKNYKTGLDFLSAAIGGLQGKNVFTPQNTPGMDSSIKKLIVEMHTVGFENHNHLWGSLGAKYIPSVLYKVRLITIQEELAESERKRISGIEITEQ